MTSLLQEPWSQEEWDDYIERVVAQGVPDEADDLARIPLVHPLFDPQHPVSSAVFSDPLHPLNT